MPVDEVTLAPNLEAVLFTPAVGKRGRHVDAFQTYHDFYKDELHIPQRGVDAALPNGVIMHQHYGALAIGIGEATMTDVVIIGVDLAKNVFQLHGAAADGTVVFRAKATNSS